ncbi:MAG: single-stranded-DNA-specific exonuclease RecJ [Flavobacteriales bacterium]|nr:single-stranded-DNA-specific exonuclease RecJ [Flavobacteriales bacterium]
MEYKWSLKKGGDVELTKELAEQLNIGEDLASLLINRDIHSFEEARSFFRPDLSTLHDPFLMKDMDKAVRRLTLAIEESENILVYGDYDVDGTTSVSLVYSFLEKINANVGFYIPDRYKEGYGLSYLGIDFAEENGIDLMICLDCGIKAVDKVKYAKDKGIDIIICDHHRPGKTVPDAYAVLDAKQKDCPYPYKELCGCGVGFKLLQGFVETNGYDMQDLYKYLDLVSIAIGADIVPITGENRTLAYYGLKVINENPRPGIKALMDIAKAPKEMTITDVVFIIGPRINAAGRIHTGARAVELLVSDEEETLKKLSVEIDDFNTRRKTLDKSITREALEMIANDSQLMNAKSSVVFKRDWHKGVVGIVASRLTEHYYRPTIVLTENDGKATGSARSVKHFDVYNAIEKCSDLLENFGGHKYAAGLTMKVENIQAFQERFETAVAGSINSDWLTPEISIEREIDFERITPKFINVLNQMAPFGPGNMKPVFVTHNCQNTAYSKILKESHLKLYVNQINSPQVKMGGIAFGMADKMKILESGKPFSVAYQVYENEWQGNKKIEIMVKDIKLMEDALQN